MPAPVNPSFEAGDAGTAANWTVTITFGGWPVADFAEALPKPYEDFAGTSWGTDAYVSVPSGTGALFDVGLVQHPRTAETFIVWTGVGVYAYTLDVGIGATFPGPVGTLGAETFEASGWGNVPFDTVVAGSPVVEDFSSISWNGGEALHIDVPTGTHATFGGAALSESFSPAAADIVFIPDPGTNTCTTTAPHGQGNGYKVTVGTKGRLAGGFVSNQVYYFVNAGTTTFQLARTFGGTPITITDVGSGTQYVHADEAEFWTIVE